MESGKLRHQVTIQRPREVRGELGGTSIVYEDWLTVRAEVLAMTAREQWQAGQVASEVDHRVRIRFRRGITAKMRLRQLVSHGSPSLYQYFDIEGEPIDMGGNRRELVLLCVKRDAEGFRSGDPYSDQASTPPPDGDAPTADSSSITADSNTFTADAA